MTGADTTRIERHRTTLGRTGRIAKTKATGHGHATRLHGQDVKRQNVQRSVRGKNFGWARQNRRKRFGPERHLGHGEIMHRATAVNADRV